MILNDIKKILTDNTHFIFYTLSCSTESPLLTLHKKKNKNNIKRWKHNQLDYERPIYIRYLLGKEQTSK